MKQFLISATALSLCLLPTGCKSDNKDAVASNHAAHHQPPATNPATTRPVASNTITHFWFETDQDNPPGRREWVLNGDHWEERYADGHVTKFKIVRLVPEGQYQRPQLVRIPDDRFDDQLEVLLPPPVEGAFFEFRHPGEQEWRQYRQVHLYPAAPSR
ncbi:MAG TPA: hypothetical protein VGQ99_00430 [Tepidisphaeraceae bacterium]|nr:hypothetical protein [Tepidisphaeraceae bacterium]